MKVGLFVTCLVDLMRPNIGFAAIKLLEQAGCEVVVYEAFHQPGGVLKYGIPDFRLPNDVIDAEIDKLRKLGAPPPSPN